MSKNTMMEWERNYNQLFKGDVYRGDETNLALKTIEKYLLGDIDQDLEGNDDMTYNQVLNQYLSDRKDLLTDIKNKGSLPIQMAVVNNFIHDHHPSWSDCDYLDNSNPELAYTFLANMVQELKCILIKYGSVDGAIQKLKDQINESHGVKYGNN